MNRSERRKMQNTKISLTKLNTVLAEERKITIKEVAIDYSAVVAFILHSKVNMGSDEIRKTIDNINDLFDSILKDYLDINDIKNTLEEETGIVIK